MGSQQQTRRCWGDHASYLETLVLPENPEGSGMFRKSELAWCTGPCEGLGCTFTPAAAASARIPRTLLCFKDRLTAEAERSLKERARRDLECNCYVTPLKTLPVFPRGRNNRGSSSWPLLQRTPPSPPTPHIHSAKLKRDGAQKSPEWLLLD